MSFDFNELEDDVVDLSLKSGNSLHKITVTQNKTRGEIDVESKVELLEALFSLDGRLDSVFGTGERTLTVGASDNVLLERDFIDIVIPGPDDEYNHKPGLRMDGKIVKISMADFRYNILFENYVTDDSYVMDAGCKVEINKPLLIFHPVYRVQLGTLSVPSHADDIFGNVRTDALIFQGVYKYVSNDLFGRKHWKRISRSISIRRIDEYYYELKDTAPLP